MKPHHWIALAIIVLATFALSACSRAPATGPNVMIKVGDGHGSGVFIGNGIIITAAHVVGANGTVDLLLDDGTEMKGRVLWANTQYDIAAIRPDDSSGMAWANLSCTVPQNGEEITAVGNPTAFKFLTMWGKVAGTLDEMLPWLEAVPVDMTVIPGMSGGGVFNARGEVVGISVGTAIMPFGFGATWLRIGIIVPGKTVCDLMGRVA